MKPLLRFNFRGHSCKVIAVSFVLIGLAFAAESQDKTPASAPEPAKPAVASRPAGSIDGQVTDDSGKPVADAQVGVGRVGGGTRETGAMTDAEGRFRVKDLAPGVYIVGARTPGYIQPTDTMVGPDGLLKFYRPGETVNITLVKGGVITGMVTDQSGDPVVGIGVTAVSIAGSDDTAGALGISQGTMRPTDDRGIYRIYGLRGGKYMVYAGAARQYSFHASPFDHDAPTYYPSSTRDTTSILNVQPGQELTGIDIRYRGDRGYEISGTIVGSAAKFVQLALTTPENPTPVGSAYSRDQEGRVSFSFPNTTNGDYKIIAYGRDDKAKQGSIGTAVASVRNGDATGIVVRMTPLSFIGGRYLLTDPSDAKCEKKVSPGLDQIVAAAMSEKKLTDNPFLDSQDQAAASVNGEFQIADLTNGNYRLRSYLPTDDWYIKSISRTTARAQPATQTTKSSPSPAELIALANGVSMSNLMIELATGAGAINGQVAGPQNAPNVTLPGRLYLVPSEKEWADDTLRFSEAAVSGDGTFSFRNLAPGSYFLLSKADENGSDSAFRPVAWDASRRAALVRAGEAIGVKVEIKRCQRVDSMQLIATPDGSVQPK